VGDGPGIPRRSSFEGGHHNSALADLCIDNGRHLRTTDLNSDLPHKSRKLYHHQPAKRLEQAMNEDVLNTSIRKFLKKVGVTSQREIELAVRSAVSEGRLKGNEALPAQVVLTLGKVELNYTIEGAIELE